MAFPEALAARALAQAAVKLAQRKTACPGPLPGQVLAPRI